MNGKVLLVAQKVILNFSLVFALAVALEWGLLLTGWFGDRPVIVASFFICVDLLFTLAVAPTVLFGLLIQVRQKSLLWRVFLALLLALAAVGGSIAIWSGWLR